MKTRLLTRTSTRNSLRTLTSRASTSETFLSTTKTPSLPTAGNELADYDPLSIIVITDTDWRANGVLLVSLHNVQASGRGYVFAFPHPADQAASVLVDIDVGNNSWEEACGAAGVDVPEPPAFMKVFEPYALDR